VVSVHRARRRPVAANHASEILEGRAKHHNLDEVQKGIALKAPLAQLAESKEKGPIRVESCDAEERTQRCHRQR
jgi:hypothetical protein